MYREVRYLESKWIRQKVASDNNSRQFCKQAKIKLLFAFSFRKMFVIGQNLRQVHLNYFFHERLVFFWLTLVNSFFSLHKRNNQIINTWSKSKKYQIYFIRYKRYKFSSILDTNTEEFFFFTKKSRIKTFLSTFFHFSHFHECIFLKK